MSEKYRLVKDYYDHKRWSQERVRKAVGRWITAEEYKKITGLPYE